MSWQDDAMAEQEAADALNYMGEAEWRDTYGSVSPDYEYEIGERNKISEKETEKLKKETRKIYNAKYWEENKEKIAKARKEKYKEDRDKILARNKKWLKDNKEHWNAYQRAYRKRKKEESEKQ